jgi:xanthine dehydrogenase YagS FAD-binding subunit
MRPFDYARTKDVGDTLRSFGNARSHPAGAVNAPVQFLAGGTTLVDLMKLDVMRPERVIDINGLREVNGRIEFGDKGLRLGALARMSEVAADAQVKANFPAIAQALQLAASQQIRNMATLGGNVLQRTRCPYFRDTSYANCNKRNPGSGCAAMDGFNRMHAVLGASDQCIATYPGDFAQALLALDAQVEIAGARGTRTIPFASLHRPPEKTPHIETTLAPGELITAFAIPAAPFARRSLYLKIRDRESYEFALASAAVALEMDGGNIKQARVALGGLATRPWLSREAEAALAGKPLDDSSLRAAAEAAFRGAQPRKHNSFKVELGKETLMRALRQAAALEIPT